MNTLVGDIFSFHAKGIEDSRQSFGWGVFGTICFLVTLPFAHGYERLGVACLVGGLCAWAASSYLSLRMHRRVGRLIVSRVRRQGFEIQRGGIFGPGYQVIHRGDPCDEVRHLLR